MAKRYRKKPVEIEAVQFLDTTDSLLELNEFMDQPVQVSYAGKKPTLQIHTLEGVLQATPGDFIIKGIKGEFYPCKPDIFEKTYDLVEGNSHSLFLID